MGHPGASVVTESAGEDPIERGGDMTRRSPVIWLVTLVTMGSGVVNLASLIGPSLPQRVRPLREVFPLEFIHLSRFFVLLIGFALVVSSLNIYRRKKRAYQSALLLSGLSVVFHITKGLDYEEALFSLALMVILFLARSSFTVRSGAPDFSGTATRLAIAALLVFAYGVAGFWFLDPRHFGLNFTLGDSLRRTLEFVTLTGDPGLTPHTRYARWFLESLSLMTVLALGYIGFVVFRPVIYQFRTHPRERALATQIVTEHGRSSLDYFKYWPDKSFFFSPSQRSVIAYRVGGSFAMALGDPVGPESEIEQTAREFIGFCKENDWRVAFHQTLPDFLPVYRRLGFHKLKIGDDAIVDAKGFSLEGGAMKGFRNMIRRMENSSIRAASYEPPLPDPVLAQAKEVSDEWLQIPGRRERAFTLGRFDEDYVRATPIFAAEESSGRMLAFANIIPSYSKGESTIDLMRRRTETPNGIMDYLFVKLILHNREKGFERFNMGMAPMAGFQEREDATVEERAIHFFFKYLNFLFSYEGLRQFKAKYATSWEPRYVVYRTALDLPKLAVALGKVSEIKE
jgi:phosphatidylglycerol lysyltransferase